MRPASSVLIGLLAATEVVLIVATWPLWFYATDYPQVALIPAGTIPLAADQFLSIILIASCLAIVAQQVWTLWSSRSRSSTEPAELTQRSRFLVAPTIAVTAATLLSLLDQHRLQPWHWLAILLLTEWVLLGSNDFLTAARATLASIYVFAALSRLGPEVDSEMSRQILRVILSSIGQESVKPGSSAFFAFALTMNVAEICIGLSLLSTRTRRPAVVAAVLLHFTLLLCLSPLGLNHHPAVLVWNAFLLLAVTATCWGPPERGVSSKWKLRTVITLVFLFPASGLLGVADNWLSWQVYSPRPEILSLTVDEGSVDYLPKSLLPFVQPPRPLRSECLIRLDRWSLECKHVPVYPEDRFQIAVARDVVHRAVANGASRMAFRAELEFPHTFPWWKRSKVELTFESEN